MGSRHSNVYCGNNSSARNGKPIGTKSRCLRVGIGKGLHLPCTNSYRGPYNPIDGRRFYCGDQANLPAGYDVMGSNSMCLSKGIGIGKAARSRRGCGKRNIAYILIFLILSITCFLLLFYTKPVFVTTENTETNVRVLDGIKLAIYTAIFMLILALTMRLIFVKFR